MVFDPKREDQDFSAPRRPKSKMKTRQITTSADQYFIHPHGYLCHHAPELLSDEQLLDLAQLQTWNAGEGCICTFQKIVLDEVKRRHLTTWLHFLIHQQEMVRND